MHAGTLKHVLSCGITTDRRNRIYMGFRYGVSHILPHISDLRPAHASGACVAWKQPVLAASWLMISMWQNHVPRMWLSTYVAARTVYLGVLLARLNAEALQAAANISPGTRTATSLMGR